MVTVLNCIAVDHNLGLVLVAALVCLFGSAVTLRLLRRSVDAPDGQRVGWQFLASVAGGGGVWATHFVAMLAYETPAPVSIDAPLTILSLVIAMAGLFASFLVSGIRMSRVFPALGGAMAGLAFSAMHYTGMFAYRVVGLVEWELGYVVASILLTVMFSTVSVALTWLRPVGAGRSWIAPALLVTGIVSLHFTAMAAFRVTPVAGSFPDIDAQAVVALALAIAVAALIILGAGLASYLIDTNAQADSRERLRHLAAHDALTGLPNRSSFNDCLKRSIGDARAGDTKFAIICVDLNRFKEINDTLGHSAGDEALRIVASRMADSLEDGEFVARLGGDEFAAVKPFVDRSEVHAFASRLSDVFNRPMRISSMDAEVGASIGAAIWPDDAEDLDELINDADLAMYHAKHAFLESVCFYDAGIGETVRKRRKLAEALRNALEHDQLGIYYQVQMSLSSGEVRGYEALLRWTHPQFGSIPPSEFIPVAEENGLVTPLGAWVLRRACQDAATWASPCRVAVNVSAVQFMDANLPRLVQEVLIETGLPPHRLELELTETALIRDKTRSLHIMRQIKALGVGVALDDFGSGYSSLETLRSYPFDKIKLDRAFVEGIERDRQSKAIVRAVLTLGKSLDIPVLAEGIETEDQIAILRAEGCDEGQGFLLGRPSPNVELATQGGPAPWEMIGYPSGHHRSVDVEDAAPSPIRRGVNA
ncbi:diguanylate cyclase/phosphodiesterase (GGDEF & EAL domains) with PAS/PAC sensor(s) (plasmid) [Sinorhizobium sojae CCBAU 05684]|uniref:Diguanylate cyclase/phosphodiesterase (GGDEF & EAL domains) with PAS/PAC sensor(S) n=1 Tax=Sinorhizobium sojae CCBAU 05684 TaxID=716928 RepID=A0A249PJU8_9HYPH|nr:bifunctional diguanylate cyclase/phosphodiesterase [Sinorhizobium sojae]ASY66213.1 diguanylate cyclase/phosphodiesterase (GGDEF & EAL domains) with PAS/PAC sensor(s) [Sinorhizobium sojae CCBAU 05684]